MMYKISNQGCLNRKFSKSKCFTSVQPKITATTPKINEGTLLFFSIVYFFIKSIVIPNAKMNIRKVIIPNK